MVTNGLILSLDAADRNSYPGSGASWNDVSGNGNHFTLFNSPSHSNSGGFINFNGTNQYARSTATLDLSPYSSITIEICFRVNTNALGMGFEHSTNWNTNTLGFGFAPNSNGNTLTTNIHHTNNPGGSSVYNYDGLLGTNITVHTNVWSRVVDSTGRNAYINAVERTRLGGSRSTSVYSSFRNDHLYVSSRGGTSLFAYHDVFFLRVYGRKLDQQEIQQNFNALRGRYGI